MNENISIHQDIAFGKACIADTRISVDFIVELTAFGWSIGDILEEYPQLTCEQIQAALDFAQEEQA